MSNNEVSDIDVREDGYINATQLCKAGNKILRHYISSEQTHNYLENLSSNIKIPILKLFDYKIGKSYVHRKVAYHLSHWISPQFETQFDNCLKEYDNENNTERIQLVSNYNQPLVLNNIEVTTRQEDGYINLTALCKAGNKEFNAWFKNKKTEAFLQVLSSTLRIPVDELVKYETGSNENRAIWGHPQIAINIAQWISQEFDVQVSKWIFELKEQNEQLIGELSNRQIRPRLIKDTTFKLKLLNNEILDISIRKDGYINATQLCKAGNKLFGHYQKSKQTQDYLQALSSIIGIPILDLLDSKVGGSHSGTYVHRKVAYHLAQWISPHFAVQVSNVLDELMLTGRVELGKEKTNEELEMIQEQRLSIGIEPYLTNDITYIFEFTPEKEHLKNSELLNDKNIHFFEIGVTSDIKERKKAYSGYKLLKVFVYSSRQKAAMAESYMKNIVVELKMTLEYKNKKECMFGTYEDLDRFIEIISEHNLNGNKEPEEEKHNNNIEMYKIQTDKEIEIKRIESEMEMEIQKNKQTSIMSLFERKLITFEQFNESFQKI